MEHEKQQKIVSDLDWRLEAILQVKLSRRAQRLFKFVWRSELARKQTDVSAAIAFLNTSRRPAYEAIKELEAAGLICRQLDMDFQRRKLLRVILVRKFKKQLLLFQHILMIVKDKAQKMLEELLV